MLNKDRTIHIQSSHYSQIPISDNTAEYKRVIQFLEEKDYDIAYYLKDLKDDERYVAIVVDNAEKCVFASNVTCMAAWCRNGTRYPLNVNEFIDNYDEFVINDNFNKYNEMIENKARKR